MTHYIAGLWTTLFGAWIGIFAGAELTTKAEIKEFILLTFALNVALTLLALWVRYLVRHYKIIRR